jgi:hypothetical protein
MRAVRGLVLALAVVLLAAGVGVAKPKARRVKLYRAGEVFCTNRALVWGAGAVVVQDRCYVVALVRKADGTFLAFLDPEVRIPPGQLVRLGTPVVAVPVDTLVIVPVRVEEEDSRLTVILTGPQAPNLTVIFQARL